MLTTDNPMMSLNQIDARIDAARDLKELFDAGSELCEFQDRLEREGRMRRPKPGNEAVKEAVKDALLGPFEGMDKFFLDTAWDTADEGIEEGVRKAFSKAVWEIVKQRIERAKGKVVKELAEALKHAVAGKVGKALEAASKAILELPEEMIRSLKDHQGILQEALNALRREYRHIDKKTEAKLRKWLIDKLGAVAKKVEENKKKWTTGIAKWSILLKALIVFMTPMSVVDEKGYLYLRFNQTVEKFHARVRALVQPPKETVGPPIEKDPSQPKLQRP